MGKTAPRRSAAGRANRQRPAGLGEGRRARRAIACKAPFGHVAAPWTDWAILADIERDAGDPDVAGEAKQEAITAYFAYRRDGGENHDCDGRL